MLFSAVGVGARFIPPPYNIVVMVYFTWWRIEAERGDHVRDLDTTVKALIDLGSQVGAAYLGFTLP